MLCKYNSIKIRQIFVFSLLIIEYKLTIDYQISIEQTKCLEILSVFTHK